MKKFLPFFARIVSTVNNIWDLLGIIAFCGLALWAIVGILWAAIQQIRQDPLTAFLTLLGVIIGSLILHFLEKANNWAKKITAQNQHQTKV